MLSATRKNGNTSGQFAFLSPPGACMRSRSGLSSKSSQWCCSRSVVQKSRIARTGNPDRKLQWRCELSNQAEEEEALDERAMRAAEIHEVLQGLQDFKDRIINGTSCLFVCFFLAFFSWFLFCFDF